MPAVDFVNAFVSDRHSDPADVISKVVFAPQQQRNKIEASFALFFADGVFAPGQFLALAQSVNFNYFYL